MKKIRLFIIILLMFHLLSNISISGSTTEEYVSSIYIKAMTPYASGITTDGSFIWVVDYINNEVNKYTISGSYTSFFSINSQSDDATGITNNGTHIWIVDSVDDEVYKYTITGTYINSFDISAKSGDASGITEYGGFFEKNLWIVDVSDDYIYKYDGLDGYENPEWTIYSDKYEFTWDNGPLTDYILIRKDQDNYPSNVSDGSEVDNVTGTTEKIIDYLQNEETYYSMWAWNSTYNVWSSQYNFRWVGTDYANVTNESYYGDVIVFEGYVSGNTAYVNYSDSLNSTVNTTIYVYEINGSTGDIGLFYTNFTSDGQAFQRSFSVNTSNAYEVILYLNHTIFGFVKDYFLLFGEDRNITSPSRINDLFDIFGPTPFGWSSLIGFFVLLGGMFSFGSRNVGVAMILTGGVMAFLSFIVGATFLDGGITAFMIVVGILVQWTSGG